MTTELKNQIQRQFRFNLPENMFHITTQESKSSTYFYIGTESKMDDFENFLFDEIEVKKKLSQRNFRSE